MTASQTRDGAQGGVSIDFEAVDAVYGAVQECNDWCALLAAFHVRDESALYTGHAASKAKSMNFMSDAFAVAAAVMSGRCACAWL